MAPEYLVATVTRATSDCLVDDRKIRGYDFGMSKKSADRPSVSEESLIEVFSLLGKRWNGRVLAALMDGPANFTTFRSLVAVFVFGDVLMIVLFGRCRDRSHR